MRDWSREIEDVIAPLNLSMARQAEVVEELNQHVNDRYNELLISGVGEEQAYQILMQDLTDGKLVTALKATIHATPSPVPVGKEGRKDLFASIWNDLRYGARCLSKAPALQSLQFSRWPWE